MLSNCNIVILRGRGSRCDPKDLNFWSCLAPTFSISLRPNEVYPVG
jgi:hypothetical protein